VNSGRHAVIAELGDLVDDLDGVLIEEALGEFDDQRRVAGRAFDRSFQLQDAPRR